MTCSKVEAPNCRFAFVGKYAARPRQITNLRFKPDALPGKRNHALEKTRLHLPAEWCNNSPVPITEIAMRTCGKLEDRLRTCHPADCVQKEGALSMLGIPGRIRAWFCQRGPLAPLAMSHGAVLTSNEAVPHPDSFAGNQVQQPPSRAIQQGPEKGAKPYQKNFYEWQELHSGSRYLGQRQKPRNTTGDEFPSTSQSMMQLPTSLPTITTMCANVFTEHQQTEILYDQSASITGTQCNLHTQLLQVKHIANGTHV